jgi:antitoxin (DNA-binding transcriptional repressor) of toxin-antitoxin stability system
MYYSNSFSSDTFYEGLVQAMSPVSERYPPSWHDGDDALVYNIRDLNQHPARIMSEIENSGNPGFITRDGCFVAIITPLLPGQVESRVLGEMAREIGKRDRRQPGPAVTADWCWSPALPAWP